MFFKVYSMRQILRWYVLMMRSVVFYVVSFKVINFHDTKSYLLEIGGKRIMISICKL